MKVLTRIDKGKLRLERIEEAYKYVFTRKVCQHSYDTVLSQDHLVLECFLLWPIVIKLAKVDIGNGVYWGSE